MDSPARLTTASARSSSRGSDPDRPSGVQPTRVMPGLPVPDSCCAWPAASPRVRIRRSCPSSAHAHASALPRNPLPPPITTFMRVLDDGSAREVCCFIMAAHPTMRHFLCVVVFLLLPSLGLAQEKTID